MSGETIHYCFNIIATLASSRTINTIDFVKHLMVIALFTTSYFSEEIFNLRLIIQKPVHLIYFLSLLSVTDQFYQQLSDKKLLEGKIIYISTQVIVTASCYLRYSRRYYIYYINESMNEIMKSCAVLFVCCSTYTHIQNNCLQNKFRKIY